MPRGIQRKGGAGKSMRLVVVGASGKPAGQNAEVGRAIAAAAPPFVKCRDGGQKLRNSRSCPRSQQLGLRWFVAGAEEPATQPSPALAPRVPVTGLRVDLILDLAWSGIAPFARGDLLQHRIDPGLRAWIRPAIVSDRRTRSPMKRSR